jgi:hypothetical protein
VRRAGFHASLGAVEAARRLRTALDPDGDWVGDALREAHGRLTSLRAGEAANRRLERMVRRLGR